MDSDEEFRGYDTTALDTKILALFLGTGDSADSVKELSEGQNGLLVLSHTPFYRESGGQVSDIGRILGPSGEAAVSSVTRLNQYLDRRLHVARIVRGTLALGDTVQAEVDALVRDATRRNHTATHLLHAALRKVLGAHVKQAGSLVAPDRLRFDFVHHAAVTPEELAEIERLVNEQVRRNTPVLTEERSTQEAMAAGAMALFGEKYGDRARVVSIPGFSMELCGGTHCRATGDIGFFTIVSEGGVAAGVRRIEALTGAAAVAAHQTMRATLDDVLGALGTSPDRARASVDELHAQIKRLQRDLTKQQISAVKGSKEAYETVDVQGIKLVRTKVTGLEKDALRGLVDSLRGEIKSGVVVVGSTVDDRVQIVAGVTPDLTNRISAGLLIKALAPIVGGKGGGRADFAEAGGKEPAKIEQMLQESSNALAGLLAAAPPSTKK